MGFCSCSGKVYNTILLGKLQIFNLQIFFVDKLFQWHFLN